MKVLLVDDSKAIRMIVQRTLKQAGFSGHQFIEAENGAKALDGIEEQRPHFVLSDWNMPEMKGIELPLALRERGTPDPTQFYHFRKQSGDQA